MISTTVKVAGTITDQLSNNGSLSIAAEASLILNLIMRTGLIISIRTLGMDDVLCGESGLSRWKKNTNRTEGNNLRLTGNLEFKDIAGVDLMTQYTYQTRKGEGYSYASSQTEEEFNWSDQKGLE